jgi:hypothetical protein
MPHPLLAKFSLLADGETNGGNYIGQLNNVHPSYQSIRIKE